MTRNQRRRNRYLLSNEQLEARLVLSPALLLPDPVPLMSTTDHPDNHVVPATDVELDGVVSIFIHEPTYDKDYACSGSLLPSGRHILTAAHCLDDMVKHEAIEFSFEARPEDVSVRFAVADGLVSVPASRLDVHPSWNRQLIDGSDIAIIELDDFAPVEADRYEIARVPLDGDADTLDFGHALMFGYGDLGTGLKGEYAMSDGQLRYGWNQFETTDLDAYPQDNHQRILYFDFDSGQARNDTLGSLEDLHDLGLGDAESMTARGDSGGPVFVNHRIAGVTSAAWGGFSTDEVRGTNSSFGDLGLSTRVSSFAHWIDDTIGDVVDDGDPEFSAPGWLSSGLAAYQGDSKYSYGGTATYSFADLEPGWYDVSAIAPGEAKYTTASALYSIHNGVETVEVVVDQRPGLNEWRSLDYIEVPAGQNSLTVKLSRAAGGSGAVRADALRITPIPAMMMIDDGDAGFSAPNWQSSGLKGYQGDSMYGYGGSATYSFTGVTSGWYRVSANTPGHSSSTNNAVYTITSGGQTYQLTVDQRPGTDGWAMLDYVQVPEGVDTLTVTVSQGGGASGAMRTDAMRIERIAAPAGVTIDDGDEVGFAAPGSWTTSGLHGYQGDSRYGYGGAATYDFTDLTPGNYRVTVQRPGHKGSSANAIYQVVSGSNSRDVSVDQRTGTHGWQTLTSITVPESSTGIRVTLSPGTGSTGAVRADAVRVEPTDSFFDRYHRDLLADLDTQHHSSPSGGTASRGTVSSQMTQAMFRIESTTRVSNSEVAVRNLVSDTGHDNYGGSFSVRPRTAKSMRQSPDDDRSHAAASPPFVTALNSQLRRSDIRNALDDLWGDACLDGCLFALL